MERRIVCTACFAFGLLLPRLQGPSIILLLTLVACSIVWRKPLRNPLSIGLVVLCLLLGSARCWWDLQQVVPHLKGRREVMGTILESPRRWGHSSVFFFEVTEIDKKPLTQSFKILVQWRGCEQNLAPGDVWELSGRFSLGERALYPGAFDQQEWLWSQGAVATLSLNRFDPYQYMRPPGGWTLHQLAYRVRVHMMRNLQKIEDVKARALVAGVVFGETQSLPKDLQDCFRRTGTSHLLAASGMNVALLAALILGCGKVLGFGPWRVAPLAIPGVIGYAFLAGCAPSITRAATGTTLALIAIWIGRRSEGWNNLCLSVWILLLWDPRQIYDLGFQLSAVAVVGLMASPTPPEQWKRVTSAIILTLSATIVTLPFFWCSFGELSTTLLLANLILGPIVELLFPLGLLAGVWAFPPLIWVNEMIAKLSLHLVRWLSQLDEPLLLTQPTWVAWLGMIAAIALWLSPSPWRSRLLAWPVLAATLLLSYQMSASAKVSPQEIRFRRIGLEKPFYWVSSNRRELLVLSEEWQEKRALQMMRKLGCSLGPEVVVLKEDESFSFKWVDFEWKQIEPLLRGAPYTEIQVRPNTYRPVYWFPPASPFQHSSSSGD